MPRHRSRTTGGALRAAVMIGVSPSCDAGAAPEYAGAMAMTRLRMPALSEHEAQVRHGIRRVLDRRARKYSASSWS